MPEALRAEVLRLSQATTLLSLDDIGRLDARLGDAFAAAAQQLIDESGVAPAHIRGIGSHGQTLRHAPGGEAPFTLQLGDANRIAERTGITTVADFRRRDVAAGGQGAPLVPAFHAAVLANPEECRAVLNIGGIANLTLLSPDMPVRGFDTGPGNGLMDAWCLRHCGEAFDSGEVHSPLLARLQDDPWLQLPPPKSTGRDQYHLDWLDEILALLPALAAADVQASLAAFSAESIAAALRREQSDCRRLLVCGGGLHNRELMRRLADALPEVVIESTAGYGVDPDFLEAMAFAWLARETLAGRPGNLAEVTGARGPRVLGAIHPA
jgi:anhydro-N-acetylmuramic acid kinase